MCKKFNHLLVLAGTVATLFSCSVDEFVNNGGQVSKQDAFTFVTTSKVEVNIDYGPLASRALVLIYSENPLANSSSEDAAPNGQIVGSAFLDDNGRYNGIIEMPSCVKDLYFYSVSMAAPQLKYAELRNDVVSVTNQLPVANKVNEKRKAAEGELVVRKLNSDEITNTSGNFYTIVGGWDNYGNVEDPNHLVDYGNLTSDDVHSIENYFWYIKDGLNSWDKPGNPTGDRLKRLMDMRVDNVNMVIQEQYEENGKTYDVESAEVWFTFLTEYAWNENVVGYYFFDKNNPPKSASEIDKKFIILPNASKPDHYPFDKVESHTLRYPEDKVPTTINKRYQLLYVDENGKASKFFPPNIEIGFFIIANGFEANGFRGPDETINGYTYTTRRNGKINADAKTFYSNYEFNAGDDNAPGNTNPRKRYVACRLADGTVVYGCEDASNSSYDDMLFTLTASPNKAMHTEGGSLLTSIPAKKVPRKYEDKSENYTYAFENIWPDGGDYDLNDVIVHHSRVITKDQFNDVSKVVDDLTFEVNQWTTSSCSFAIHMRAGHLGDTRTMPDGAWYEEDTGSFFFAEDVSDSNINGHTLTLVREFEHPVSVSEIQDELNPFIVNQSMGPDCHTKGRVEIHLPMGEITSMGKAVVDEKNPAYGWFINDEGYPYALKIPLSNFEPCDEKVRIGSGPGAYPMFNRWAESYGKENKDWYLHK